MVQKAIQDSSSVAETLPDLINRNKLKSAFSDESKTRALVERVLGERSLQKEANWGALCHFVEDYFIRGFSARYSIISNDIFSLPPTEKEISFKDKDGGVEKKKVEVPTIIGLGLTYQGRFYQKKEYEKIVYCPIPEIIPEAKNAILESLSLGAEIVLRAYKDPLVSRILFSDYFSGDDKYSIGDPVRDLRYWLVWCPSPDSWRGFIPETPKLETDPAILMEYNKTNFLIHQWEIKEEESLEFLLRRHTLQ